jgi:chaperonin GroEL
MRKLLPTQRSNMVSQERFRESVDIVVETVAEALEGSYGPLGCYALLADAMGQPSLTKDGVTIASNLKFTGELEDRIKTMIIEPCLKVAKGSGDGTSTAGIISSKLYFAFQEMLGSENAMHKKTFGAIIEEIVPEIQERLNARATVVTDVTELERVARISLDNEEDLISLIMEAYGDNINTNILYDSGPKNVVERSPGYVGRGGFFNPLNINSVDGTFTENDCKVIIIEKAIMTDTHLEFLMKLLSWAYAKQERILVVTQFIDRRCEIALERMFNSFRSQKGRITCAIASVECATTEQKDRYSDMCAYIGVNTFSISENFEEDFKSLPEYWSYANVKVHDNKMILEVTGRNDESLYESRLNYLKQKQMTLAQEEKQTELNHYNARVSEMLGSVAKIFITGATSTIIDRRIKQLEDGIKACRSAVRFGYTLGMNTDIILAISELYQDLVIKNTCCKYNNELLVLNTILATLMNEKANMITSLIQDNDYDVPSNDILDTMVFNYHTQTFGDDVINPLETDLLVIETALKVSKELLLTNQIFLRDPMNASNY